MQPDSPFIIILLAVAIFWNAAVTLLMFQYLRGRGYEVSVFLLWFFPCKYVQQYIKATEEKKGKAGSLYYHWVFSLTLTVTLLLLAFLAWQSG